MRRYRRLVLGLLWLVGCATTPVRVVKAAPDVKWDGKAALVCAFEPTSRELLCMTPADAALALDGGL